MIVTEEQVHKALEFLRDSASSLGQAKARTIRAEHMLRHTEALLYKSSNATTSDSRRADARTDPRYLASIEEDAVSAGEYAKLQALRQSAEMLIEAWRSEQANYRAMKI